MCYRKERSPEIAWEPKEVTPHQKRVLGGRGKKDAEERSTAALL